MTGSWDVAAQVLQENCAIAAQLSATDFWFWSEGVLVELDLLLKGRRLPLGEPLPAGDCYAFVARGDRRPDCQVYAWTLRQPLPAVPVPLLPPDRDVAVDLGAVFAVTYQRGRYARSIDYTAAPSVGLGPDDSAWVLERAQAARP